MKTSRLFSMAAVALVMAACSTDDNITESATPARQGGKMRFVATIAAPASDAATRTTYTESGTSINVTWKVNDEVALIHNGVKDVVTVKTVNADGSATIDGDITVPAGDDKSVAVVYPAASVDVSGSGAAFKANVAYAAKGFAQDGTKEYIAANIDARQGSGTLKVSGSGDAAVATLDGNVSLTSGIAIWKLSLIDGSSSLSATQLSLKVRGLPVAGAVSATGKSDYYMCVAPAAMPTGDLTIVAVAGSDVYTYTKSGGVSLTAGKYYQSEVVMTKVAGAPTGVEAVDLGLSTGTKWANMNVGATSETGYGLYFAWGATTRFYTYSYSSGVPYNTGGSTRWSKYTGSDYNVLQTVDDAAAVNWGGDWRMPTKADFEALLNGTNKEWTTINGVNGYKFMNKSDPNKYIFLPAAGYYNGTSVYEGGSRDAYWSSSLNVSESTKDKGLVLDLSSSHAFVTGSDRDLGCTVRPVQSN